MYLRKIAARGTNVAVRINLSMLARSSRDSSKVGQLLLSAPKREIEISFLFLSASRAPRKTPSAKSGFLLLSGCSLCMSLCPSLCSVPTVALKAAMIDFFLFYAELGSVIRAPFLTDRSISITKSSACSKGSALWRPVQPGHDESDTYRQKRNKASGRWGGRTWLSGGEDVERVRDCVSLLWRHIKRETLVLLTLHLPHAQVHSRRKRLDVCFLPFRHWREHLTIRNSLRYDAVW